jgi:hypothetical protein
VLDIAAVVSGVILILAVLDIVLDGRISAPVRALRGRGGEGEGPGGD